MNDTLELHGVVTRHRPVGESDWLVTLISAERGRINAFARGARRPGTKLSGNVEPFCFGTFVVYEGRGSFVIAETKIDHYFETLRTDLEKASYGTYFLEFASHFTGENMEAADICNLLYLTLKVLSAKERLRPYPLVRCVFELRMYVEEGLFPGAEIAPDAHPAVRRALVHIATCPMQKLFSFTLSDEALDALVSLAATLRHRYVDRKLLSLEMLSMYE